MNTLLLVATYSGGTEAASQIIAETLKTHGESVTLRNPKDTNLEEINKHDRIIFCTPTWDYNGKEGQPHEDYITFMEKMKGMTWENKPCVVMGLGDSSYTHFCGSVDVLETFIRQAKGKLTQPSLRIDGYFYDQNKHNETIKTWSMSLLTS